MPRHDRTETEPRECPSAENWQLFPLRMEFVRFCSTFLRKNVSAYKSLPSKGLIKAMASSVWDVLFTLQAQVIIEARDNLLVSAITHLAMSAQWCLSPTSVAVFLFVGPTFLTSLPAQFGTTRTSSKNMPFCRFISKLFCAIIVRK